MDTSKMCLLILLLLVACGFEQTAGVECQPHLCKYVNCRRFEIFCRHPQAKRIKNGAPCGCCDKCIVEKKKGEPCFVVSKKFGILDIECEEGTTCNAKSLNCE